MPECTGNDLKTARIRANVKQWEAANACGVSESTIARWESDEVIPGPDDVDRFAACVGDITLWQRWMISHYDSFRRRFINSQLVSGLSASLTRLRFEMNDVTAMQEQMERDGVDGVIDDPKLKQAYIRQAKELQAALTDTLNQLTRGGGAADERA